MLIADVKEPPDWPMRQPEILDISPSEARIFSVYPGMSRWSAEILTIKLTSRLAICPIG